MVDGCRSHSNIFHFAGAKFLWRPCHVQCTTRCCRDAKAFDGCKCINVVRQLKDVMGEQNNNYPYNFFYRILKRSLGDHGVHGSQQGFNGEADDTGDSTLLSAMVSLFIFLTLRIKTTFNPHRPLHPLIRSDNVGSLVSVFKQVINSYSNNSHPNMFTRRIWTTLKNLRVKLTRGAGKSWYGVGHMPTLIDRSLMMQTLAKLPI